MSPWKWSSWPAACVLAAATIAVSGTTIATPSASGAVTIGSNLTTPNLASSTCGIPRCTFTNLTLPTGALAAGGLTSPIDGVVTRWRIKVGGETSPVSLRVLRGVGDGSGTGAGTGPTEAAPPLFSTTTYQARLAIRAGDRIGIDCCASFGNFFGSSGTRYLWVPALADGQTSPAFSDALQLLVNADVEPDADRDGFGDETQDRCPSEASTQGECPVMKCLGVVATLSGGPGADALNGTRGRDVIQARGGEDAVNGRGGNDLICGGAGDDALRGNAGADVLVGGSDSDLLRGGKGLDELIGGTPGAAAGSARPRDRCPDPGPDKRTGCSPD